MHKCKICGEEFENTGVLLQHYKKHKKEGEIKEDIKTIPLSYCPEEIKYLRENQTVGLKILGIKKGNEIIINDIYLL